MCIWSDEGNSEATKCNMTSSAKVLEVSDWCSMGDGPKAKPCDREYCLFASKLLLVPQYQIASNLGQRLRPSGQVYIYAAR